MRRHRTLLIVVGVIVALLIVGRVALPGFITQQANEKLDEIEDIEGHIDSVQLGILRGAYEVHGLELTHTPKGQEVMHVQVPRAAMTMSWSELFRGQLVGKVLIEKPQIHTQYVKSADPKPEDQLDLAQQLQDLFPFRIDEVRVREGLMTFRTPEIPPENALSLENVNLEVHNITNTKEAQESSYATFNMQAQAEGSAPLKMEGRFNPTMESPTFEMDMTLRQLKMSDLNPWLEEYVTAKAEKGTFEMTMEVAAAEGKFAGYVRPFLIDAEIESVEDANVLEKLWAGILDVTTEILENDEKKQDAARVPLSGPIENPDIGILPTITSTLRNAFVSAFARSLEDSVSIKKLKATDDPQEVAEGGADEEKESDRG